MNKGTRIGVPGNREHCPKNSREQGTSKKNRGSREHAPGNGEHRPKNSREQGTLVLNQKKRFSENIF